MLSIAGTFENGSLKLEKVYPTKNPVKVIVTFLEEIQTSSDKGLSLEDFSFSKSKLNLQDFKGSLADNVIEERHSS